MVSIVDDIIVSGIVNVTTSFLCDMFKSHKNKTRQKTLEGEISKFIEEFTDTELDSGSFFKYLSHTETILNFKEYIQYSAYKNKYKVRIKKQKIPLLLTRETFIKIISENAISYVNEDIKKKLNYNTVYSYFEKLLFVIEEKLISRIPDHNVSMLYFINSSLAEMEERILDSVRFPLKEDSFDHERTRATYLKLIKRKNKTTHVYGIDDLDMYSFYVFPTLQYVGDKTTESKDQRRNSTIEWTDIFKESNIVSIIGGAGFGKSLFLKNLINKHEDLNVIEADKLLPIYCDLKQFKLYSKNSSSYSLEQFIVDSLINHTGMDGKNINKSFLDYFLSSGRCLIMFDALDEVEAEDRDELNSRIASFFEVTNKNNKVCITSRALGFTSKTRITLQVHKVKEKKIKEYLDKMCKLGLFYESDIEDFLSQCGTLIRNGFLTSFLQVSLLVNIFKAEKELPENKIDLYEKCIEYISKKRERDQKKTSFDFKIMSSILDNNTSFEKLALLGKPNNIEIDQLQIKDYFTSLYSKSYLTKNETLVAINEFLKFCSQRTELYVAGNQDGYYKFYHRSFFEFFYSKCMMKEFPENRAFITELMTFDLDSEMFDLSVALMKKHDYDRYIDFLDLVLERTNTNFSSGDNFNDKDFLKCCSIFSSSNEKFYLNAILEIIAHPSRILTRITESSAFDIIGSILYKFDHNEQIKERLMILYKEEVLSTYLFTLILEEVFSVSEERKEFKINTNINTFLVFIHFVDAKKIVEELHSCILEERKRLLRLFISYDVKNIRVNKIINKVLRK
ncbi:NACHT domain-containing NTPase [Paenibacillus sp. Mc5Re-14]|uniref:NACHT domain-containing protein n=1 Tax=Paenibacillus sp. Mc5Re-14 TaxID=1030529 RepID=UPI000A760F24|nr:NACHT domain-containing protein [Paenibacillus sp. Mc5Re-14]